MNNESNEHPKTAPRIPRARARRASARKKRVKRLPEQDMRMTQRELLARLRHDLRTPLNAIIGYSEMLLEDAEDPEGYEAFISDLKNIYSTGNKSLELVNTILHPVKIESGQSREMSLTTFGANLRHELYTPSNAIISFAERLMKNAENPGGKNCFITESIPDIRKIHAAAEDFLMIIRSTEDFSELSAGMMAHVTDSVEDSSLPRTRLVSLPIKADVVTAERGDLLIVEDHAMNRDLLFRHLERQGHNVMAAENGHEALSMLRNRLFDVVLLDIMMPVMDGYQVLGRMKEADAWQNIPVIMISALDEMESVVRCIEMGAEDYLTKPFDPVLLKARVSAVLEKKRLRDKEQIYLRSLEREMEIGRDIQRSFLPELLPDVPGWEIAEYFNPARQVSGDFYDAFLLSGGQRLAIVIADVCDKGVGAALFMGLFRSLIRAFAGMQYSRNQTEMPENRENRSGDSVLTETSDTLSIEHESALKTIISMTNDYIAKNHSKSNMFATIFMGVINPETGSLTYINGGHEPPVIIASGLVKERLKPTGAAVGIMPDMNFDVGKTRIEPGETLLSFTDGITEALDPDGNIFTKERLFKVISDDDPDHTLLETIEKSLKEHTSGADQSDDITLLSVWRGPT